MGSKTCPNDHTLGPNVEGCRGSFDFTLMFERIFLAIVPGSVFVALCLARFAYLYRAPRVVDGVVFQFTKIAIVTIYTTLQLSLVIALTAETDRTGKSLSVAASAVCFAAGLFMLPLSYWEHSRCPRPSILLGGYVGLTLLFDIAHTRTSWLVADDFQGSLYARFFTISVAVKALILLLESQRKMRWVKWNVKEHSPEEAYGLFGLGVYAWLNRLFARGHSGVLALDDLYPLDSGLTTEALYPRLDNQLQSPKYRTRKYSLAVALAKALVIPWLLPIAPRIALIAFRFAQPFFMETLLKYLQAAQLPDGANSNIGYGLIGASAFIYVGAAVSSALYNYYRQRALYMVRACLASVIYQKTTETKSTASNDGAALTLMSTDVERVIRGFLTVHELWSGLIEVAIGSWLLQRQLGSAFLVPLITILIVALLIAQTSKYSGRRQRVWMEVVQKRVGLTATTISTMKGLKTIGFVDRVFDMIQPLRVGEIRAGNRWRIVILLSAVLSNGPMTLTPVLTFAVTSNTLDTTTIYTSVAYIYLLVQPFSALFQMLPQLVAAFACLDRIQDFIHAEPRVDYRRFLCATEFSTQNTPPNGLNQGDSTSHTTSGATVAEKLSPRVAATVVNGNFGWSADKMSLKNVNATIGLGRLTMIVGPVASGKSTLCHSLLGEVPHASGEVTIYGGHRKGIGFCEQTPFLLNASLKENIVGFSTFDQSKYDQIIEATRLDVDISLMPSGHDTQIGSNGIMLSGGQKQRVSLARALFLESDLVIFDDILSGLDSNTEEQVFSRVFGPGGILRRRGSTVLLCTHSARHLPAADHIMALGPDGTLIEAGSFHELMKNNKYVQSLGVRGTSSERAKFGSELGKDRAELAGQFQGASEPKPKLLSQKLDKARQTGDWKVYSHYFGMVGKPTLLFLIASGILRAFGDNFSTIWIGFWSENKLSRDNSFYIGIFALLGTSQLLWLFLGGILVLIKAVIRTGTELHKSALQAVLTAPLDFLTNSDIGTITNLFSQDMTLVDNELPVGFFEISFVPFKLIGMAIVIAVATPYLASGYPVLVLILYVLQKFYLRTSRQLRFLDLEAKSPLYSHFIDTIKGIATIRAFKWSQQNFLLNNHLVNSSQRPAYLLAMIQQWLALVLQLLVAALAVILVTLATQLSPSVAFTGASFVTLITFGVFLTFLIIAWTNLETSIGAVARLKALGEVVRPESLPGEDVEPPDEWPTRGKINIRNLSASYEIVAETSNVAESEVGPQGPPTMAIKNLSLSIRAGGKVAICGRTGSGKSSLFLVLVRLLDPLPECATCITIDDLPLHRIDRATIRRRIIAVPQDPVFLPGENSIRDNLDPFQTASDEECLDVLRTVRLDGFVHDAARRGSPSDHNAEPEDADVLAKGLTAEMNAESLSAGQQQLFSLGRAILRRRVRCKQSNDGSLSGGILLLDELSSSVDRDMDRTMQEVIKREFASYTVVMVSHRLDIVLEYFDTAVVLDKGRLVERGAPNELVEVEGSRFRELWLSAKQ